MASQIHLPIATLTQWFNDLVLCHVTTSIEILSPTNINVLFGFYVLKVVFQVLQPLTVEYP